MNLFDSSALLCFLQGEAGADAVERALADGGLCGAANWSEVAQKVIARSTRLAQPGTVAPRRSARPLSDRRRGPGRSTSAAVA